MITLLAAGGLLLNSQAFEFEQQIEPYQSIEILLSKQCALTQQERDKLYREAQFAAQKSLRAMEKAERHFKKMLDVRARDVCTNAVVSGIASFAASGSKERVLITVLGVIGGQASNACNHFWNGYDELQNSKMYAAHCDECQERLWRDE